MDNGLDKISEFLKNFSGLSNQAFDLSASMWTRKKYAKGELYNGQGQVCRTAGFIVEGYFRGFKADIQGDERNIFLYAPNQILVAFKSFIEQIPCNYATDALTDACIISISYNNLQALYALSPEWEHLGRLLAEHAYKVLDERFFGYYYLSPEERYRKLLADTPDIVQAVPLHHISSYLGIEPPSLSRIRRRIAKSRT